VSGCWNIITNILQRCLNTCWNFGSNLQNKDICFSNNATDTNTQHLPARWRPKVTVIEKAKDLNTINVEDLVTSLKVYEISLNEHEPPKKTKSIALLSKRKSSKALKVSESEEKSPDGDSDGDPVIVEKMAKLSNKLQYLAKKNRKLLNERGGYKSSTMEDQKGCFNCKKPGHLIVDCPDLHKEKSKDKSKKSNFISSKFRKQIKKSLTATWEDLDCESGSEKEEAEDEENVAIGLMATVTSEAESDSDSEDENEVYYKTPREELIEYLKELLTHFELRTIKLKDLKEKYVDLMKQRESTPLDLKPSEEGLRGFDIICKTYEERLKLLCQKLQEKCNGKSLSKHEIALADFIISGIDRSKVASIIYSIYKINGKGIGFSEGKPNEISLKACCECIKERLKTFFVPEGVMSETVVQSEPKASSSKTKAMTNSESKLSKIKILKRSEPVPQSLLNSESGILKPKVQRNKTVDASWESNPKGVRPKVLSDQKLSNFQHKVQGKKSKTPVLTSKDP